MCMCACVCVCVPNAHTLARKNGINFEWIHFDSMCRRDRVFDTQHRPFMAHSIARHWCQNSVKHCTNSSPVCSETCWNRYGFIPMNSMPEQFEIFLCRSRVRSKFIRRLCSRLMVEPIIQNFKELKVSKKRSLITRKSINFIYLGFDVVVIVWLLFISSWALRCSMQSVYCSRRILSSPDWSKTSHWPFFCFVRHPKI